MDRFTDRQTWDYGSWPEFDAAVRTLQGLVYPSPPGLELNLMVFTVASLASGCRHCQAHGSIALDKLAGVDIEKVTALWTFEESELFTDRERAALRFGSAAGQAPNAVEPSHHADLREHFDDAEIRTLLGVVALSGLMNRFNDSLAVVTDRRAVDWATEHLGPLGWTVGKHAGTDDERRPDLPLPD